MRSPSIATSPTTGEAPVPSTTVPPRITRSCMLRQYASPLGEDRALADEALAGRIDPHELASLHAHEHVADGLPFRRRSRFGEHPVAVELVDLLQGGEQRLPRDLRTGGLQRLLEDAARRPRERGV